MIKNGLAIILFFLTISSRAQISLQDYDTIPIRKPVERKLDYEFDHPFFRAISIKRDQAIAEGNYQSALAATAGPNSLIGIMGRGPVPNYLMPSTLISDPGGYGWAVDLYTKGTTLNDLVKTSEGKASKIPENLKFYWQSEWLGLIRQGSDTLAFFGVSESPRTDPLFKSIYFATRGLHPPVDPKRKEEDGLIGLVYKNYGVYGEFKGAKLMIIFYERNRTAYIFLNDQLDAIFQIDYDNPGSIVLRLFKKDHPRVSPVLMIRKGLTEGQHADLYRLAVLSMLMAQVTR
jgi:hypothetical protein